MAALDTHTIYHTIAICCCSSVWNRRKPVDGRRDGDGSSVWYLYAALY